MLPLPMHQVCHGAKGLLQGIFSRIGFGKSRFEVPCLPSVVAIWSDMEAETEPTRGSESAWPAEPAHFSRLKVIH